MRPPTTTRAILAAVAAACAACADSSTGPRDHEGAFDLELRNVIVQSPAQAVFTPELTILASGDVDVTPILSATVTLPGGEESVWGDPGFEPFGDGHRGVLLGNPGDAPLPSGTYTVRLGVGDNRPLTFVEEEEIAVLDGPEELTSTLGDVFTLSWTAPVQPHDWAVELWRAVADSEPTELELVHQVVHGSAEDGAGLEVEVELDPHVEPGGLFMVKLVMEDERNRREVRLQLFRPEPR